MLSGFGAWHIVSEPANISLTQPRSKHEATAQQIRNRQVFEEKDEKLFE
jgi:hypothetical protein